MDKPLSITPYLSTAEQRSLYYRLWLLFWPPLVLMIRLHPGALGLYPPQRGGKGPDHYRRECVWLRKYMWHATRRALGVGRGELIAVSSVSLATWLLIIEIIFRSSLHVSSVALTTVGSSILIFMLRAAPLYTLLILHLERCLLTSMRRSS
jgi:hypothetical protein